MDAIPVRAGLQVAREALSELELPHLYRAVARGSPRRQELFEKRGLFQAPYLEARLWGCCASIQYCYRQGLTELFPLPDVQSTIL